MDHSGVPNSQLVKENAKIATFYQGRSVAEQNSMVLSWNLLMESPKFDDFRSCLCSTDEELLYFRQLVVNCVMATDIFDNDLSQLRNSRWEKQLQRQEQPPKNGDTYDGIDDVKHRKATLVIEYLIQASDVTHTMQHWNVYRKWVSLSYWYGRCVVCVC